MRILKPIKTEEYNKHLLKFQYSIYSTNSIFGFSLEYTKNTYCYYEREIRILLGFCHKKIVLIIEFWRS